MAGEHTIYLSSLGCLDTYTKNTPSKFANRLPTPILLPNGVEYEVGLASIMFPGSYYAILSKDDLFTLEFITERHKRDRHTYLYRPRIAMLAGDMKRLVRALNKDVHDYLKVYYGDNFINYFNSNGIFHWDEDLRRITMPRIKREKLRPGDVKSIYVKFSGKAAKLLGFHINTGYEIYGGRELNEHASLDSLPDNCGVDYIYVYTDIVQPTIFGGRLVNILDCFTLASGRGKGIHNTVYKLLNTNILDQISILITDQNGHLLHFAKDSSVTCLLRIKPRGKLDE